MKGVRMRMARYEVDAVVREGRSVREVARAHGATKSCIYELIEKFAAGGLDASACPDLARIDADASKRWASAGPRHRECWCRRVARFR